MPLPLLLIPLIVAALDALAAWAVRAAIVYTLEQIWDHARSHLIEWAKEYMPEIVRFIVSKYLGVDIAMPLGPRTLTDAVNMKIASEGYKLRLTDITDGDAVKMDVRNFIAATICESIPGIILKPEYFTPGNRDKLRKAMFGAVKRELQQSLGTGEGLWLTGEQTTALLQQLQAGFDVPVKPEPIEDAQHKVARSMSRWWADHLRRQWVEA